VKRTSTKCNHGECIAVDEEPETIIVSDTKNPDKPPLRFSDEHWRLFIGSLKSCS